MTTSVGLARPLMAAPPHVAERAAQPPPDPPAGAPAPANRPIAPNPSLRIEPKLGLVVFELRDGAGQVTRSVPTERELRAYRTAALRGEDAATASRGEDAPDPAQAEGVPTTARIAPPPGGADQIRNPPGGSPSSASALEVPAEGAPKVPADSPARLIR